MVGDEPHHQPRAVANTMSSAAAPPPPPSSTAEKLAALQAQLNELQKALASSSTPATLKPPLPPPPLPPVPAVSLLEGPALYLLIALIALFAVILLLVVAFCFLSPSAKHFRTLMPFADLFIPINDDEPHGAAPATALTMAPVEEDKVQDNGQNDVEMNASNRERVVERIKAATAEERELLARSEAEQLDALADSSEAAAAAEAAVAAAGSPGAALLAALVRNASAVEVRALLLRGANPDAAFLNRSALAVAARGCGPIVVKVLLEAGATIDIKDDRGWTPLMHAIDAHSPQHSREAVLTVLLDAGAAVDVWGNDLKGPLDLLKLNQEVRR